MPGKGRVELTREWKEICISWEYFNFFITPANLPNVIKAGKLSCQCFPINSYSPPPIFPPHLSGKLQMRVDQAEIRQGGCYLDRPEWLTLLDLLQISPRFEFLGNFARNPMQPNHHTLGLLANQINWKISIGFRGSANFPFCVALQEHATCFSQKSGGFARRAPCSLKSSRGRRNFPVKGEDSFSALRGFKD